LPTGRFVLYRTSLFKLQYLRQNEERKLIELNTTQTRQFGRIIFALLAMSCGYFEAEEEDEQQIFPYKITDDQIRKLIEKPLFTI